MLRVGARGLVVAVVASMGLPSSSALALVIVTRGWGSTVVGVIAIGVVSPVILLLLLLVVLRGLWLPDLERQLMIARCSRGVVASGGYRGCL